MASIEADYRAKRREHEAEAAAAAAAAAAATAAATSPAAPPAGPAGGTNGFRGRRVAKQHPETADGGDDSDRLSIIAGTAVHRNRHRNAQSANATETPPSSRQPTCRHSRLLTERQPSAVFMALPTKTLVDQPPANAFVVPAALPGGAQPLCRLLRPLQPSGNTKSRPSHEETLHPTSLVVSMVVAEEQPSGGDVPSSETHLRNAPSFGRHAQSPS